MVGSYISMPAARVSALVGECFGLIEAHRVEARDLYVRDELARMAQGWWNRLFKVKLPTFEEFKASYESHRHSGRGFDFCCVYDCIDEDFIESQKVARMLATLAENGDPVFVSAEDLHLLLRPKRVLGI